MCFCFTVWPIWWKLNHGDTKIRPAHVGPYIILAAPHNSPLSQVLDVAQALHNLMDLPPQPQIYSLPGVWTYTFEEMLGLVSSVTYNPHLLPLFRNVLRPS